MADEQQLTETYASMFLDAAARFANRPALVFPGATINYEDLVTRSRSRAAQLAQLGVGRGDRFGLLMHNGPEMVEFLLAAALVGACAVPINTRFRPPELAHVIADAELKAVITCGGAAGALDYGDRLGAAIPCLADASDPLALSAARFPHLRTVATTAERAEPGLLRLSDLPSADPVAIARKLNPADPLLIMYTSGTTAHPKGCVLTSGALVYNARAIVERLEIPSDDAWWDPLPLFHMGGIMLMSSLFAAGGRFISQAHFTPGEALELIELEHPTVVYPLFPTITLDLIHDPGFAAGHADGVRLVGSVAPPDVQRRIQDAFPSAHLFSAYGITELCGCVAFHSPLDPETQRLTSCGRPMAGFEMRIVDPDTNRELLADERGELVGRGPQMFTGYYGNSDATAAVIDPEGYFHTGDLCSIDPGGEIYYHGRIKDMLKVGGENVSAIEIESFLATHPAIKMAQVVGVPHPRLVEVAAAFIELAPGQELSERDVIDYCEGQLARFKVPRHVRFVSDWPMSATKVQKFRLRERLVEELGSHATTETAAA
jgi:fatty-acyl-CoA synthase